MMTQRELNRGLRVLDVNAHADMLRYGHIIADHRYSVEDGYYAGNWRVTTVRRGDTLATLEMWDGEFHAVSVL